MKKRIISIITSLALCLSLLPAVSVPAAATTETPTVEYGNIYANGIPITIEAGTTTGYTKIWYGDGTYLDVDPLKAGEQLEADLSSYTIYGGSKDGTVASTSITMTGGTVEFIYGGGSGAGGSVTGDTEVIINGGAVHASVYGGGNESSVVGNKASVTMNGGTVGLGSTGHAVYGGGYRSSVGSTEVTITGGTANEVYGGGDDGTVNGSAKVTMTGGTVGSIYGGGDYGSAGSTEVLIDTDATANEVYGGGRRGSVAGTAKVTIKGAVKWSVYGGGAGGSVGSTEVLIDTGGNVGSDGYSGMPGDVYGGSSTFNYTSGAVTGDTKVTIKGTVTGYVYGGSGSYNDVGGSTNVLIDTDGTVNGGDVYGGGANGGSVAGRASVTIKGTVTEMWWDGMYASGGNVYGGSNNGNVGSTNVLIDTGGKVKKVCGGGNGGTVGSAHVKCENGGADKITLDDGIYRTAAGGDFQSATVGETALQGYFEYLSAGHYELSGTADPEGHAIICADETCGLKLTDAAAHAPGTNGACICGYHPITSVTISGDTEWDWSADTEHTLTAAHVLMDGYTAATTTYAWSDGTTTTEAISLKGLEAGEHTYTCTVTVNGYTKTSDPVTVKVNGIDPTYTAPTAATNLTYTGAAQDLVSGGSVTSGQGTMEYALGADATTAPTSGWSATIPTGKDADTYYVWYRVEGTSPNHNNIAPQPVTVTIGQAPLTVTGATATGRTYNGANTVTITNITLDGIFNNDSVSVDTANLTGTLSSPNAGTYSSVILPTTLTLTGTAKDNYTLTQPTAAVPATVTIGQTTATGSASHSVRYNNTAAQAVPLAGIITALPGYLTADASLTYTPTYSGSNLENVAAAGGNLTFNVMDNLAEADYSETVTVKVTGMTNYSEVEITVTVNITKKTPVTVNMDGVTLDGKTYDGAAITYSGSATGSTTDGAYSGGFTYEWYDENGGKLDAAPKNAGTYKLRATVSDTANYDGYAEKSVTIGKAPLTVAANDKSAIVGAAQPELTYTVSGLQGSDQLTTPPSLSCTPDMNTVGEYVITISGAEQSSGNYIITHVGGKLTVSNKTTPSLTLTPSSASLSGGGTVTLTVGGLPTGGSVTITCDNTTYNPTGSGTTWSVTLPNTTAAYVFTASFAGDDTHNSAAATCTVNVTQYTSSGGGGGYTPPSTPSTPIVSTGDKTEGGTTTTETTATPNATTKGDTATATISTSVGNQIVEQAKENGSAEIVIAPEVTGNAIKTEVSIPAATVGDIGSETAANLTVSTPVADVTIPNGGLSDLASAGGTVTVTAEKTGNTVTLEVMAGGEAVSEVTGGITLTVPHEDTTPGTVAVLVHEDGSREVVRKSVADDGTLTFTIPLTGSATLELVDNATVFEDVADDAWYSDAADFVSARGLFGGVGDTVAIFDGNSSMTRGMLAVVLHRLENNPDHAFTGSFDDVPERSWYGEAIHWMAEAGIAGGYGNGDFGAEDDITREQLAVMLWRYAGSPAPKGTALNFTDAGEVGSWAVDALIWAQENGIMQGNNNAVNPKGTATRAHVAQMLKNFMENIMK